MMVYQNNVYTETTMQGCLISSSSSTLIHPRKTARFSSIRSSNSTNKYVHFSPKFSIHDTISVVDMTAEEIQNTWLSDHEQKEIRQLCRELAKGYYPLPAGIDKRNDHDDDGEEITYRGLESFTPLEKLRKRWNRSEARMAVLDEQDQQYLEEGMIWNEKQLAVVYQEVSIQCQSQAEKRALQDRKEIEQQQDA